MRVLSPKSAKLALDTKDWRILNELVADMRAPIAQIAKKCLLSRQSVEYRLKQLQQNHLIIGSRSVIDITQLGYKTYQVFIEVHTPSAEKELLVRAKKADSVNAIIVYSGKYNLEISITARSVNEFLKLYHSLVKGISIRNDAVHILLSTLRSEVLPDMYFPDFKTKSSSSVSSLPQKKSKAKITIDHLDIQILHLLSKNATLQNMKIAKLLKSSKDTIAYRIQKLQKAKYIIQYRPVINYSVLGLSINSVLVKTNLASSHVDTFEKHLENEGSVLWSTRTFGYYNYIIYTITNGLDEFHQVINTMKEQFGDVIKTYEILFAFKELKYDFMADSIAKIKF